MSNRKNNQKEGHRMKHSPDFCFHLSRDGDEPGYCVQVHRGDEEITIVLHPHVEAAPPDLDAPDEGWGG